MKKYLCIPFAFVLILLWFNLPRSHPVPASVSMPIVAHAHNDYQHDHPLWDALHFGYRSIEVDVRLVGGVLFVAHDSEDIRPFNTLKSRYLEPLRKHIMENGGRIYDDGPGIILLIDVKTDASPAWLALNKLLNEYSDIICGMNNGTGNPVSVIISGNRDLTAMNGVQNEIGRYDGRLADLEENPDNPIITLISIKWTEEFSWDGENQIPESELVKLNSIISLAHSQNRLVRFWDTDLQDRNHQNKLWNLLLNTGADIIGTDKLEEFHHFSGTYPNKRR